MKEFFRRFVSFLEAKRYSFFILLSFVLWTVCMFPYLSGKLAFVRDAVSYFNHIGFYTENIVRGVYPLWDPQWTEAGAPYIFFLRRMGEVNPFYWLIVLMHKSGIAHFYAYRIFIAFYYFLSCFGIYVVLLRLLRDKFSAFIGFNLFLFSAFSFHLFWNYIVILLLPLIWILYFLISFYQDQRRVFILGITFCLMLMFTTYIPFFSIFIIAVALFFFGLIYPDVFWVFCQNFWKFIIKNKFLIFLCSILLIASLLPGIDLYLQSKRPDRFALPGRSAGAETTSAFGVSKSLIKGGDLITHGHFEYLFGWYSDMDLDDVTFPLVGVIIFLLSLCTFSNRKQVFYLIFSLFLGMLAITTVTPLYDWFYQRFFIFKYMRQMFYLFWIAILPFLVLLISDHFYQLTFKQKEKSDLSLNHLARFLVFILIHIGVIFFLIQQKGQIVEQYIAVLLSLAFWSLYIFQGRKKESLLLIIFLLAVFIPAKRIYGFVASNSETAKGIENYQYNEKIPYDFSWYTDKSFLDYDKKDDLVEKASRSGEYYAAASYQSLKSKLSSVVIGHYLKYKVYLYDQIKYVDSQQVNFNEVEQILKNQLNLVYVVDASRHGEWDRLSPRIKDDVLAIQGPSEDIMVESYDMNHVRFKVNLTDPKILVYTDSYDPKWNVLVDGKKEKLLQANFAFKGVVVPEGEHVVEFRFSTVLEYCLRISLVFVFAVVFIWLVFSLYSNRKHLISENIV